MRFLLNAHVAFNILAVVSLVAGPRQFENVSILPPYVCFNMGIFATFDQFVRQEHLLGSFH